MVELTFANPRVPDSVEIFKLDDNETAMGNATDLVWGDDCTFLEASWPTGYEPAGDTVRSQSSIGDRKLTQPVELINNRIDFPKLDKTSDPSERMAVETQSTAAYAIVAKHKGPLPLTGQTLVEVLPVGVEQTLRSR